ncbi:hypothetical protein [Endozoicomonas sp. GU-1]|uniref:hypothetical protein n=1 Tax=Endozoicomonas sp. GU-1 TaxID=3009078 RepID=UPI0022B30D5D|nr:hypothetical protein [Endozoicomonas sp. GU-1]WBA79882.1 hypothetical protein O2T12_16100 [Endozoicomonas sp. GU-1]WBA87457.1 hypothetical protein O3276_05335 [Endozoicomonas sp. GU-1]
MQPVNSLTKLAEPSNYSMAGESSDNKRSDNNSPTNKYINYSSPERSGKNTQKTLAEHETITVIDPKVTHDPEPNVSASLLPSASYPSLGAESETTSFDAKSEAIVMDIIREMKSKISADISLPDGWKIMPEKTPCSDLIEGLVIDNTGMPRIQYSGKTAIHDAYLIARQLNYENSLQKRTEIQSAELIKEQQLAAYSQLKELMGAEVFKCFAVQLDNILYNGMAHLGYGSRLFAQVDTVLNWYDTEQNKSNVEQFLHGEFKGTKAAIKLEQFIEMFVIHEDLDLITSLCTEQDIGISNAMFRPIQNQGDIYQQWKQIRDNSQSHQHVTQNAPLTRYHSKERICTREDIRLAEARTGLNPNQENIYEQRKQRRNNPQSDQHDTQSDQHDTQGEYYARFRAKECIIF